MVSICLLPEIEVSQSVTKSIAIFIKWSIRYFSHLQWILLNFGFVSSSKDAVGNILPDVFIHAFPVILALDEAICVGISLMT